MQQLGFEGQGGGHPQPVLPDLEARGFDTVVAGELIEHLETPIALLLRRSSASDRRVAHRYHPEPLLALASSGRSAGHRLGEHGPSLLYLPIGMMEMAGRTGLTIERISTESQPTNTHSVSESSRAICKGIGRRL